VLDGRYKIEAVLGQGGMGMVFRATQTSIHRPVAVKTLSPGLAATSQFFERFRREAEIASRLRHPNVITIYDFGRAQDGTCYYVMELLEGESLRELVKRDGPMSLRRAVNVIEQACRGLAHAHEQGAVHRDIKPHNLMLQQLDGRDFVKVLDFGLVKAVEQDEEQQLTSTGQVLGTPQYMPPEQAGGEDVDHRSDLYSMGAVFYFCLTGTSPYGANTVRKALTAVLTQPLPTVASKRQGAPVPRAVEEFFQKALAREQEDRFQSAQEFLDAMLDAVEDLSPEELDALPTGSPADSGVSKPGRSSPSGARSPRPLGVAARGSSKPSARGSHSSAASAPRAQPSVPQHTQPVGEDTRFGSSGVRKVALVVVPLLLLAAGSAFIGLRRATPAEAPPPPVEVKKPEAPSVDSMLRVQLRSTPAGAAVFVGDVQIGTTPLDRQLRRDEIHELTFRLPGHRDAQRKLDFTGVMSDSQEVSVSLEPMKTAPAEPRSSRPAKPVEDDAVPIFE
jgi:serine/threonine-protein kinase